MSSRAKTQPPQQKPDEKPPGATGRNSPTAFDYLALPPRLPRQVRPLSNETLDSYLGRFAVHNGLPYEYFSSRISRMRASPLDITQALTGNPTSTLQAALPELRLSTHLRTKCGVNRLPDFDGINPACELCAASHGSLIHALVWTNGHDAVCQRHQRWVGSALQPSTGQIDLQRTPEILAANQRHRRLARRHGHAATRTAFTEALQLIDDMRQRNELPGIDELILRLLNTQQPFVQIATTDPRVQAAHYPAAAGLTSLLLQPDWINNATATPQGWKTAAPQLATAVAIRSRLTDYTYIRVSRWNYNRQHDPAL